MAQDRDSSGQMAKPRGNRVGHTRGRGSGGVRRLGLVGAAEWAELDEITQLNLAEWVKQVGRAE